MEDDDGFVNYVETTVDPGPWINIGTALFCALSVLFFPCIVALGRKYERHRNKVLQNNGAIGEIEIQEEQVGVEAPLPVSAPSRNSENTHSSQQETQEETARQTTSRHLLILDRLVMPPYPDDGGPDIDIAHKAPSSTVAILNTGAATRNRRAGARRYRRGQKNNMWQHEQQQECQQNLLAFVEMQDDYRDDGESLSVDGSNNNNNISPSNDYERSFNSSQSDPGRIFESILTANCSRGTNESDTNEWASAFDEHDGEVPIHDRESRTIERVPMEGDDIDLCCGPRAWWKPVMIAAAFDRLLDICEWDREMKRILTLSIPFSISSLVAGIFDVVRLGLVANFIGTDAVAAYTIVDLLTSLTEEFCGGFAETSASLCSHAVGRRSYKLAGEYIQINCILYTLFMIPNVLIWMFLTDDIVRLFGFNDATVQMAQSFARFRVVGQWFEGLDESYGSLLEVIGHERFTMSLDIVNEVFSTSLILAMVLAGERPASLRDVGIIEMGTDALFFGFSWAISNIAGWVKKYNGGMLHTNALRNTVAVRTVVRTAIPLSLGQLLQYGEWEVLTIFVAALGPAEVTTWGIVGEVWDMLEAVTEGFGDAGEIRVGFHLGAQHPSKARLSSYKSLFVSIICATLVTSVVWIIGEDLARLLTPDPTLQRLIVETLPLIGLGNVALTAGTVSWALVGAQGRYRLATFVAFVSSWCVTLPLAAIYTYGLHINLEGVTSAVVLGNSVTGTCLLYILVRSDWQRLSRIVAALNEGSDSSSSGSSTSSSAPEEPNTTNSC